MILLDLTGTPQTVTITRHKIGRSRFATGPGFAWRCGSAILVTPVDDRLGGERLPRLCGTCYEASERAREMEE